MLNDVEQLKHLLSYDLGLAEKDCAWHSPLLTFSQLKSLKNMRIRTKESEDKRREKWMQKTQGYLEKREERRDSVPPLRTDSFRNVGLDSIKISQQDQELPTKGRYSKATSCACKSTRNSNKRSNCHS